jgi:hypothetical protein
MGKLADVQKKYGPLKFIINVTATITGLVGVLVGVLFVVLILMEKFDDRYLGSNNMRAEENGYEKNPSLIEVDLQNKQRMDRWDLLIPNNN